MKIAIIDGGAGSIETDGSFGYAAYLQETVGRLRSSGHQVRHLRLAELKLQLCTGCWSCWIKTPGRCPHQDDTTTVIRAYVDSDLVLFATPLRLGFVSARTKTILDKLVTLFLPHIEIFRGEFIHSRRYDRYPLLGCVLHAGTTYDAADLEITTEYFRRYAFHFQTELAIAANTSQPCKELVDAIDRLQRLSPDDAGKHRDPDRRSPRGFRKERRGHGRASLPEQPLPPPGRGRGVPAL
jgi:multimeric flavodoxin WrbA